MSGKVFITSRSFGQVSDEPIDILKENNIEYVFKDKPALFDDDDFINVIGQYDAVILGADNFSAKIMENAKKLKIVCKHGTGVDNIDLEAAKECGICVTNVPGTNSDAVADVTFGLIIDAARRISYAASKVKQGKWDKIIGTDVCNKILGILGFGAIGKKVAQRALGFNMKVIIYDPYIKSLPESYLRLHKEIFEQAAYTKDSAKNYPSLELQSFEEVIKNSDFLTIHIPLNDSTRNLIDESQILKMKKGSIIINASRGGIVNEEALYKYLKNGHIAGAGLDVTSKEPPDGSPLLTLDNVTILPHIASYSKEAINAVSTICSWNVVKALNGQQPDYIISI